MGYGAVDLGMQWRNITAVIAISGLFTFAWTTSSLVAMVANYMKIVEQLELERMKELDLRCQGASCGMGCCQPRSGRRNTPSGWRRARPPPASSFFAAPQDLAGREAKRRAACARPLGTKFGQIREQERADENKLGQDFPLDDSGVKK